MKYVVENENIFELFGQIDERDQRNQPSKTFTDSTSTRFHSIVPSTGFHNTPHKCIVRIFGSKQDKCFYFLRKKHLLLDQCPWLLCQDIDDLKFSTTVTLVPRTETDSSSSYINNKDHNLQPTWANIPWPLHQFAKFCFEKNGDIEVVIDISNSSTELIFGAISWNDRLLAPTEIIVRYHGLVLFRFEQE